MSEYRILDNTVTPLVGHFDPNNIYRFICDNELNRDIIISAEYNLKVTNINGINATVNTLSRDVKADINLWTRCELGDDLTLFVDITRTGGYDEYQRPVFNYKIGNLDTPLNLGSCDAWSGNYNGSGSQSILDISLKPNSSNNYYLINGSQPNVSANSYITMLFVFDNITNKIHCCTVTNAERTGVYEDFKLFTSIGFLNFIDEYNYWIPQALQKNEDNGYLSIISRADVTPYVNYVEYSEYDDGNGSNPSNPQDDDNRGGDGNHDNSSDTLNSNDYNLDGGNAPLANTSWFAIYNMTPVQMKSFMTYLVGASWQSAVQSLGLGSVFGGIQKVATMPFDVSSIVGNNNNIVICGINTNCTTQGDLFSHRIEINCGNINISRYFGDFKDYNPYTKVYVYLPYIGVNEINTNQVMGKNLNLTYGVDILDGSCVARLSSDGVQFASYSGNVSTEYPIAGRSGGNALQTATNLLGQTLGSELGTLAGLTGSLITGASSTSTFQTVGGIAGNWGNVGVLTPFVYIERPVQSIPNAYDSSFGWTCNKYLPLNVLSGYTEVDESLHLSTTATDEEKEMLKEILTSGFYINDND